MTVTMTIEPRGLHFAVVAVIRDARTARLLHVTEKRHVEFIKAVLADVDALADANGWTVMK